MRVILTHEQADFDALAALLGARLLDEGAQAVLPRRMNRNARAYLALYAAELPLVDPRDLPAEPIETVTLVDTQSLVTIKGLTRKTTVSVIDHHPRRDDLPADWKINLEQTGATTTLMVESLASQNSSPLTSAESTLLLLGIYEDTGSLTYAGTTPRDVKAAAWLIEHGASLQALSQFLDPPLSPEQRGVYQKLMADSQALTIQGQQVVLATVEAESLTDEISSIAHKMREVLDPDGLFILVSTGEGIRIVARSVSDKINVARILSRFGGGGHDRAASCLIPYDSAENKARQAQLKQLGVDLQTAIEVDIPPMTTVGQIMSRHPRMIPPEMPAEEALVLMQRYGYEGFPVAEDERIIGLLTRRAVDRALSHKMNLPAASLMEAGQVVIQADAPIEDLRDLIVSSGWGQIPVIDSASGKVIGIATRTDLIKILAPAQSIQRHVNLAAKLEAALPPVRLALLKAVVTQAADQRMAVYIVGGFVRDLLLDRPGIDFDLVVEGDALLLGRSLARKYGGRTVTHGRFGTAKWFIQKIKPELAASLDQAGAIPADLPDSLDLISARTEFYDYPTALPTVESSGIKLDLHRRDFTINTLALRLDGRHYGELHDYWGGLKDLRKGIVRVLHSLSFVDDPTRLLRAARFEQRFGFKIEKRTLDLMKNAFEVMKQVSGDRLRHEFNLILQEPRAGAILDRLGQLGVLAAIHPTLTNLVVNPEHLPVEVTPRQMDDWGLPVEAAGMPAQLTLNWLAWLGRLPLEQVDKVASRLRLPAALKGLLIATIEVGERLPEIERSKPSALVALLDRTPMLAVLAARSIGRAPKFIKQLDRYALKYRHIQPGLDGKALIEMGLKPSRRIRKILEGLRSAWLDGQVTNRDEERLLLEKLLQVTDGDDERG